MFFIKKIILFLARIIASAFASSFITLLFFVAWVFFPLLTPTRELFNSAMCYFFHAIPICEFNFLNQLGLLFTIPSQYESSGFINNTLEGFDFILKPLIQSIPYIILGFIAVLFFKFMWNDTRPKNKVSSGGSND